MTKEVERPSYEPTNASAPHLFNLSYYPEELASLVGHLGLSRFHVLGSSWGTIVAQNYALQHPPGLASLALSGPLSDSQLYIRSQWDPAEGNLGSLPPYIQGRLHALEASRAFDSEEYKQLNKVLEASFTVRTYPPPDCYMAASAGINPEIYVGIQGSSEFTSAPRPSRSSLWVWPRPCRS